MKKVTQEALSFLQVVESSFAHADPSPTENRRFREWFARMLKGNGRITLMVAPWMARIMLETNTGNRTLSQSRACRYAKDMKSGAWERTGEPIIFSDAEILNDGQTRLSACEIAGVPFLTDVTFGVPRKAFQVTGIGAKRTLSDVFSINGESSTTRLAGALNWLNCYLKGFASPSLSITDGVELLAEHPDIRKSLQIGGLLHSKTHLVEPSLATFLHYVFSLQDADKANNFFEFLNEGVGASGKYDPRHMLRERLIANKIDKAKLPSVEIAALCIKAWNAFRAGKQTRYLKWQTSAAAGAEDFPRAA